MPYSLKVEPDAKLLVLSVEIFIEAIADVLDHNPAPNCT